MADEAPQTWVDAIRELSVPDSLREALLAVTGRFVAHSGEALDPARDEGPGDLGRFVDLGLLGRGGLGEVRRVHDPQLERVTALKTLQSRWAHVEDLGARFLLEARLTAQLQHPGIPPVHEVGILPDGRPWFTLPEVRGARLDEAIAAAHATEDPGRLRRLVEHVRRVVETVGYAHARGVVHRDLKPSNIMLGEFGEVWVLDWGLGKVSPDSPAVITEQVHTRHGAIQGTPAFMAPEQARGDADIGAPADVYAVGGVLHVVLTGRGHRPAADPVAAMAMALEDVGLASLDDAPWPVPEELAAVCRGCLELDPDARPSMVAVSDALIQWLDGVRSRERALDVLADARSHAQQATRRREQAVELRQQGRALEPRDTRAQPEWWPAWHLEDRADALDDEAEREDLRAEQLAQAALTHAPGLSEIRSWIADRALRRHQAADATGDRRAVARASLALEQFGTSRHAAYLEGRAAVSLATDPPGAEVVLHRWVTRHRLLVLEPVRSLGRTPLVEVPLEHGSFVLELRHPERAPVRWPVLLRRGEHETGCRPGQTEAYPVYLPRPDELGVDECYVPAGPCIVGRNHEFDRDDVYMPRTRVWVDGVVVSRDPVTTAGFLPYLDALVDEGREEELLAHAPTYKDGEWRMRRDDRGHFVVGPGTRGDVWESASPMVLITWGAASAYAAWRADQDAIPWRLGWEVEWEKAARGADGRPYPWGWRVHSTWARMRATPDVERGVGPVDAFPTDASPYRVRGLAGNACEWVLDPHPEGFCSTEGSVAVAPMPQGAPRRRVKGGAYLHRPFNCRVDGQASGIVGMSTTYVGTRLFRPLDPHSPDHHRGS